MDLNYTPAIAQPILDLLGRTLLGKRYAVVIDGGYLDLRSPSDLDRQVHMNDSLTLMNLLRSPNLEFVDRPLHWTGLVNNLSGSACAGDACQINPDSDAAVRQTGVGLWTLEDGYLESPPGAKWFNCRTTRNRVANYLMKLLHKGSSRLRAEPASDRGMFDSLYVPTTDGDVYVGRYDRAAKNIAVRCTALMAQHYRDLAQHAIQCTTEPFEAIVIVDFNRYIEKERVGLGATCSFALFDWPENLTMHVANCIYYDGVRGPAVFIQSGPA